ncbi:MAG: hypothetical protein ISS48_03005 [Candidatus Aenigmarchaeota archaeon]|nr:hypothetical protein [Candidatus Aenigmarchaeota archaeon]
MSTDYSEQLAEARRYLTTLEGQPLSAQIDGMMDYFRSHPDTFEEVRAAIYLGLGELRARLSPTNQQPA